MEIRYKVGDRVYSTSITNYFGTVSKVAQNFIQIEWDCGATGIANVVAIERHIRPLQNYETALEEICNET